MRAILISVHPNWIEEMHCGRKKVEVRKSRPKQSTPFKCYIYATMPKTRSHPARVYRSYIMPVSGRCGSGKIVGEFICDAITEFQVFENGTVQYWNYADLDKSCLSYEEVADYIGVGKTGYSWYISNLKIYDEPKELKFFHTKSCLDCPNYRLVDPFCDEDSGCDCFAEYHKENGCEFGLKRPPQSWCYIEALLD